MRVLGLLLGALVLAIAASAGTVYVYHHRYAPKIVSVDYKGFMERTRAAIRDGAIADERVLERRVSALREFLDSFPPNTIIITSDVAVRNVDEIPVPALATK